MTVTLPESLPLFPLPNVVLFPGMPLPLHVFEPRYQAMVRDALRGPRMIGMVLLRGDWRRDYEGRPPIFHTGTGGQIVHVDELVGGRFNIVLRGLREFVVREEVESGRLYRVARVDWRHAVADELPPVARDQLVELVRRYLTRTGRQPEATVDLDRDVEAGALVNFLAQHLDLDPLERQGLLEEASVATRARRLADVLEFRLRGAPGFGAGSPGHGPH